MSEWIKTAKAGDTVSCVDANGIYANTPLCHGRVYTIRAIIEWRGSFGLLLEEVSNAMHPEGEYGYYASRFRPVEPRKTDITIFTDMLNPVSNPIREDA